MSSGTSLAAEAQAIARVHRFGQERPVHVIKFATRHTIEERILQEIHHEEEAAEGETSSTGQRKSTAAAKKPAQKEMSVEVISRLLA